MGTAKEDARPEIYETGAEPEFVISDIARYEEAGDGLIRLYMASRRGKMTKIEYSIVISPDTLSRLGRAALVIASEAHNLVQFRKAMTEH